MKVSVFGAAGGIGKHAVEYALKKGYEVIAFARNTDKISISHKNLTKIKGEINNYEAVKNAIVGCSAVVWCIGINKQKNNAMPSLDGHKVLLKAMHECGITRLIDWGTPTFSFEKDKVSAVTVIPKIIMGILTRPSKNELLFVTKFVSESDLDWTVVRFLAPQDTPYTGNVKVGFGDVKMKFTISRADIGAFMIDQVEGKQYIRSMPIIGS